MDGSGWCPRDAAPVESPMAGDTCLPATDEAPPAQQARGELLAGFSTILGATGTSLQ